MKLKNFFADLKGYIKAYAEAMVDKDKKSLVTGSIIVIILMTLVLAILLYGKYDTDEKENTSSIQALQDQKQTAINAFLDCYSEIFVNENAKRAVLIYLDGDTIPELLILKNGEYQLYSYDGLLTRLDMPEENMKAKAYGWQHNFEDSADQTFYRFEYVPYQGLIRVHNCSDGERHDCYLRLTDGSLVKELEVKSADYVWYTYDGEKEIANDEFLDKLSDLGYDELIPCDRLYESVTEAYECKDVLFDTQKILDDFVEGKIDALDHVEEITDIPEECFIMRSYEDFFEDITAGDENWGSIEYIDFDNDGKEELVMHGYAGACLFFDAIGDMVYKVLETGSTTDVAYIAEIEGKRVIVRTDLTHTGRQSYRIMKFDACCCLIDWFHLYTEYDETNYSAEDMFMYRNNEISMEEFESILSSIH